MALKIHRSPRYPAIGLKEAIEKAKKVYDVDRWNKISKSIVAEHMGYGSVNGASLSVISAVLKYGLLEGSSESMNITSRAVDIFEREFGDPDRVQAIKAAASEPDLFRELDSAFPGKVSDAAIRSHLITKRSFLPESAAKLIRAYRETRELLELESSGCNDDVNADSEGIVSLPNVDAPPTPISANAALVQPSSSGFDEERVLVTGPLSKSGAFFRLIVSGKVGVKEMERLIKKLEFEKEILADQDEDDWDNHDLA